MALASRAIGACRSSPPLCSTAFSLSTIDRRRSQLGMVGRNQGRPLFEGGERSVNRVQSDRDSCALAAFETETERERGFAFLPSFLCSRSTTNPSRGRLEHIGHQHARHGGFSAPPRTTASRGPYARTALKVSIVMVV
ncbi:hypothetical protein PVAP13_4KG268905 [Panicum virgatum]|uniref:Uncharacterized protein n=1 Tax=Panicum virgatum TaxID=38727 RepID=A0A8T0TK63_PANVG|nr:hypothetical protein PVAP13_4KG268905 [Panicum virgatum]